MAAPPGVPVDSLSLPLPPLSLTFSTSASSDGSFVILSKYNREGTGIDAKKAVLGKGGFGTVYRFERDDDFLTAQQEERLRQEESSDRSACGTRDDSTSLAPASPSSIATTLPDEMQVDASAGPPTPVMRSKSNRSSSTPSSPVLPKDSLRPPVSNVRGRHATSPPSAPPPLTRAMSTSTQRAIGPAVIVVKVCRSPCGGAFDEMPKTGAARAAAKAADAALQKGDASGFHTRICRGEARIFRFLQIIAKRSGKSYSRLGVARLLADLPLSVNPLDGTTFVDESSSAMSAEMEEQTGPVPRLLVFERMVELDAVLTPRGWVKRKRQWTHAEVEAVSRDMSNGLAFLHANHVVHGDLKPSNVMLDSKTGVAKLIDLGASRRFVCVPNLYKESTTAVEELDQFLAEGTVPPQTASMVHTEGLGSLTGSPYFMAPEVLLQAGRYVDSSNISRSILHDYVNCKHLLPAGTDLVCFDMAYNDFKRGWGIKSDVWSWACSVLALLLRTSPPEDKKSSSTICPFDFSFDDPTDSLEPRHRLHRGERTLPRFHEWARRYPLKIVRITSQSPVLPPEAAGLSASAVEMLQLSLAHMDSRPSANLIAKALAAGNKPSLDVSPSPLLKAERQEKRRSLTLSVHSETGSESVASHAYSPHNVDLRGSFHPGQSYGPSTPRASYSNCSVLQPYTGAVYHRSFTSESSLAVPETFPLVRDGVSPMPPSPQLSLIGLPALRGQPGQPRSPDLHGRGDGSSQGRVAEGEAKDAANAEVMAASLAVATLADPAHSRDAHSLRPEEVSDRFFPPRVEGPPMVANIPIKATQELVTNSVDPHETSAGSGGSSGIFTRTKGRIKSMLRPGSEMGGAMDVDLPLLQHVRSGTAASDHHHSVGVQGERVEKPERRKSVLSLKGPKKSKSASPLNTPVLPVLIIPEVPTGRKPPPSPTRRASRINLKFKGKRLIPSQQQSIGQTETKSLRGDHTPRDEMGETCTTRSLQTFESAAELPSGSGIGNHHGKSNVEGSSMNPMVVSVTLAPSIHPTRPSTAANPAEADPAIHPNPVSTTSANHSGSLRTGTNKQGKRRRASTIVEKIWPFVTGNAPSAGAGAGTDQHHLTNT